MCMFRATQSVELASMLNPKPSCTNMVVYFLAHLHVYKILEQRCLLNFEIIKNDATIFPTKLSSIWIFAEVKNG